MKIGATIKKLRNSKSFTQEQLAEYLHVSVSAVSQWEGGKTMPDIAMAVSLAEFFDVSLDELFGRDRHAKQRVIEEYGQKSLALRNKGLIQEDLALWREAVAQYPGDFHCLSLLAVALFTTIHTNGFSRAEQEQNAKECVTLCERILRDCAEHDARDSALQLLVYLYSNPVFDFADEEKAVGYANMTGDINISKQVLLPSAYFKEESMPKKREAEHFNKLLWLDQLSNGLFVGQYDSAAEKIKACQAALTLWETIVYDGNYLFYHCRIRQLYTHLACLYAHLRDRDNTLACLKNAMHHARCFDDLPLKKQYYTSIFVNQAYHEGSMGTKNYLYTDKSIVLERMRGKDFDFLRTDDEFQNLLTQ